MAEKKTITVNLGKASNGEGLPDSVEIVDSCNIEALPDGSGVRTRSGCRNVYSMSTDYSGDGMALLINKWIPNYSSGNNGMYIIGMKGKDNKCSIQALNFSYGFGDPTPSNIYCKGDLYGEGTILVSPVSGVDTNILRIYRTRNYDSEVSFSYRIGQISYNGEIYNGDYLGDDKCTYLVPPTLNASNGEVLLSGTIKRSDLICNSYSILGKATFKRKSQYVDIPVPLSAQILGTLSFMHWNIPVSMSFSDNANFIGIENFSVEYPKKSPKIKYKTKTSGHSWGLLVHSQDTNGSGLLGYHYQINGEVDSSGNPVYRTTDNARYVLLDKSSLWASGRTKLSFIAENGYAKPDDIEFYFTESDPNQEIIVTYAEG